MDLNREINHVAEDFDIRDQIISRVFLLEVLKNFNKKLHDDIENSITGGTETNGKFPVTNPTKGSIYLYNGKIYYCFKSGNGAFQTPDAEHFEEMSLTEVFKRFVRYEDIVNDFITGGTDKALSAEMGKQLKAQIDAILEGGGAGTLIPAVRRELKNLHMIDFKQEGTLKAKSTLITITNKVAFNPRLHIEGELIPTDMYDLDTRTAIITLKAPYDIDVNYRIDDQFPSLYKFSVETVAKLSTPPLNDLIENGDVIYIMGKDAAWDGKGYVAKIETTQKNSGTKVKDNPVLWANPIPGTDSDWLFTQINNKADKNGSYETLHSGTTTKWKTARNISLTGGASGSAKIDGSTDIYINVTEIKSSSLRGEIPIEIIPKGAIPTLVIVNDDASRFKLTKEQIQNGDTVQVTTTGKMYFVVNDTKLNTEDGYKVYTAGSATSVPWSGVTGKPSIINDLITGGAGSFLSAEQGKVLKGMVDGKSPNGHKHSKNEITDFPTSMKNPTALTIQLNGTSQGEYDGSVAKTINVTAGGVGAYTKQEVDSKLNGKANTSHGNHVPAVQSANNKVFLRNDNTWQTITPENIGAASSNHNHNGVYAPNNHNHDNSYAPKNHSHSYLPLSGGALTGALTVNGNVTCSDCVTTSDERLKKDIIKITNALEKVCNLNGYTFLKDGDIQRTTGVIAQELEQVLPEAVFEREDGFLGVSYGNIVGLLIEAIKELQKEIKNLKGGK